MILPLQIPGVQVAWASERELSVDRSIKELDRVPLTRHEFHGDWNYTVHTEPTKSARQ